MNPKHTVATIAITLAIASASADSAPRTSKVLRCYQNSYDREMEGDYISAINALEKLQAAFPRDYTVNLRLGHLHYCLGSYRESEKCYRAAVKAEPKAVEAKLGYMLPLLAQEEYRPVEILARQVLTVDAGNYFANLRLAIALRLQGKYEPAENVIESMLKLYPNDISFLTELGLVAAAQGKENTAKRAFYDVLLLSPENATARDQIAKL